jgi:hypothetical protein
VCIVAFSETGELVGDGDDDDDDDDDVSMSGWKIKKDFG